MACGWSGWAENPEKQAGRWVIFDVDNLDPLAGAGAMGERLCFDLLGRRADGSTPTSPVADDSVSEEPLLYFNGMPRSCARRRASACIWLISFSARLLFSIHLRQIFACSSSR